MEYTKEVKIPEYTDTKVVKTVCDLCGSEIKNPPYHVNSVEVFHDTGTNYPESYDIKKTKVDMCGKCFTEKLIPWLKTQGAEPRQELIEW